MKRNEHIKPLSRDHHFGLLFCWKIRQGLRHKINTERISKYVLHFWAGELHRHFRAEEAILFIERDDLYCQRAINEHREIEQLIENIRHTPAETGRLEQLATKLDDHIRFEERELFPHLEHKLTTEQLTIIGAALKELHASPADDCYADEFWVNPATTNK
ncbi:MAG: hemerythrin domain-containing protein [Chitinophagaceae bacterium]